MRREWLRPSYTPSRKRVPANHYCDSTSRDELRHALQFPINVCATVLHTTPVHPIQSVMLNILPYTLILFDLWSVIPIARHVQRR